MVLQRSMTIYCNRTLSVNQKQPVAAAAHRMLALPLPISYPSFLGKPGQFGAAARDISPNIFGGTCEGKIDLGLWYVVLPYIFAPVQHTRAAFIFLINEGALLVHAYFPTSHGQSPVQGYRGPACRHTKCGTCYKVTNAGGYEDSSVGKGGSGTVTVR